jgi:hypothetical protein
MKINLKIFSKSIRKIKITKPINEKGFVIFQIDGLSKKALDKAFAYNLMPFLKKMIFKKGYLLTDYFTGVPSDTPFFQAGLLYGDNKNIPGFRWIEKDTGNEIIFKKPDSAGHIEAMLSENHKGLLKGGSSYVNLFSGGASRSTFTLSTFSVRYLFKKKVRHFDIFIIFIFHIFTLLKTIFYVIFEFFFELYEKILDVIKKRVVRPEGVFPFARAISNVIFKEIETFGAIMDISRGVPSIYMDFTGYDELSHHRGPYSISAMRTLKAIDRKIKYIFKELEKSERKYDFFIISDHGHTPSVPFVHLNNNEKLEAVINKFLTENKGTYADIKKNYTVYEFDTGYNVIFKRLFLYIDDLFKKNSCKIIYNKLFNKIKYDYETKKNINRKGVIDWKNKNVIYIMNSGPMSNIYFSDKKIKMNTEEIEFFYPGLIERLCDIEHIGFIMGRNKKNDIVISYKGSEGFKPFFKHDIAADEKLLNIYLKNLSNDTLRNIIEYLEAFNKEKLIIDSIKDFCRFKNSGDLIVFGAYNKEYVVNFENQLGAHGGAGGEQNIPFAVYPESLNFDFSSVNNSCQIYDFLYNNYVV